MPRSVYKVEFIFFAVLGIIIHCYRMRFYGDTAFSLDIHVIKHLIHHFFIAQGMGQLEKSIGECRFAMIDMGYNAEISYIFGAHTLLLFKDLRY